MVVTDPRMASSEAVAITLESLRDEGIDAVLFDRVSVEADGCVVQGGD